jgi:hypothetical protein
MSSRTSIAGRWASDDGSWPPARRDPIPSGPPRNTAPAAGPVPVLPDRPPAAMDESAKRDAEARARRAERRRARASAPAPQRAPVFGQLSLPDLREIRRILKHEEELAGYWHRVIQSRLLVVRGREPVKPAVADLRGVLEAARESPSRTAAILPSVASPMRLPDLAELWSRDVDHADDVAKTQLETALAAAEEQLMAYRVQLHNGSKETTMELLARYREAPRLALDLLA